MSQEKIVSVSDFKAHCLEYVQTAQQQCQEYIITKRNISVAKLVPLKEEEPCYGRMAGTVTIHGDIMSPVDVDEWEALRGDDWENLKDAD